MISSRLAGVWALSMDIWLSVQPSNVFLRSLASARISLPVVLGSAALLEVPGRAAEVLDRHDEIKALASRIAQARDVLYLGRGKCFPIALEGALKLKEISYIHAEGYAAGEMKHGPIALIDRAVPVIAIAPSGPLFEKTASNLQEAAARGGQVIVFSDAAGAAKLKGIATETVVMPAVDPFVAPILYAIPVQLLAYHVAVLKGTDVDQPRNLAKSVTVPASRDVVCAGTWPPKGSLVIHRPRFHA